MSPLELIDGACLWCGTDGCDGYDHGAPVHRLCADEADYRALQDRRAVGSTTKGSGI